MVATADTPEQVKEAIDFFSEREGAESELRTQFIEDLRFAFVPGGQWDPIAKAKRSGRPCYTYNRTAGAINQIVGDQRQLQPSGQVRPSNKSNAQDTANTFSGLIRDIESKSFAPATYSEAFKYATAGGWGVWRIVTQYAEGDTFDQVLRIGRIQNPLTTYFDGTADPFGRFAKRALVSERMSRSVYGTTYGDKMVIDFPAMHDDQGWYNDSEIRVAEFYRRISKTRKLVLLTDGRTFREEKVAKVLAEARQAGHTNVAVHNERMAPYWVVEWSKIDGHKVVEGPYEYEYSCIPLMRCPGRFINIEGEHEYQSLIRHGKDAARTYNYNRSNMVETVALTPRAPWLVTQNMIKGLEDEWKKANVSNAPFLRYNIDEDNPEMFPQRNAGPEIPQAYIALAAHDAEDIRQTIGYTNPAVEQQTRAGDAESGRALRTRLTAGDSGSYEFLDNYAKAIQYTWECLVEMIPYVYTSKRIERLLAEDGTESFVELDPKKLKDGRFDVSITLGPAHATARMEALDMLFEASDRMPIIAEEGADILVKYMDIRGSSELWKRIRNRLIAEGKIQPTEADLQNGAQIPQKDPAKEALVKSLNARTAKDTAAAQKTQFQTAEIAANADASEKRIALELAQMVADIVVTRMEAKKLGAEAASSAVSALSPTMQQS